MLEVGLTYKEKLQGEVKEQLLVQSEHHGVWQVNLM